MQNTEYAVNKQLPDFMREDYPKFVEFLNAYYKFNKDYEYNLSTLKDPDKISTDLLQFLRYEFASKFPSALIDDRKLIKLVRQLYASKGSFNSFELLFRAFFNDVITIREPNRNILKTSDGKWIQQSSIQVKILYTAPGYTLDINDVKAVKIENSQGIFTLDIDNIEVSGDDLIMFYQSFRDVVFEEDQLVDFIENGTIKFRGKIVRRPSNLSILVPGKYWKFGQIIRIPGTIKDTIARVSSVDSDGRVLKTEIIEYGYVHDENSITEISPFPNKPPGNPPQLTFDVEYNIITEQFEYNYNLVVEEDLEVADSTVGSSTATQDYFISSDFWAFENYAEGQAWSEQNIVPTFDEYVLQDPDLSIEKWLESRAFFSYSYNQEIKERGSFATEDGHISSPSIRLQDNYYYQLFSYVIETGINIKEYKDLLNQFHPAGLKFFAEHRKIATPQFSEFSAQFEVSE